jgi:type I restriction enzyme S subunit
MSEWKEVRFDEIGEVFSGGTPSTTNPELWDGHIAFITPYDLSKNQTPYIKKTQRYITKKGLEQSSTNLLTANNLILSSRAPIGYIALSKTDFVTNQGCKSLKFFENQEPLFHYYNLQMYVDLMKRYGVGTTFSEISKGDLSKLKINIPKEITEQKKIAKILTTCDTVIDQTQSAIEKYKAIKQGMLHDLFTRGLDANGQLRPTPEQAPELYKDSELGMIPKEWEVKRLEEIALVNPATNIPATINSETNVTFLKMEDVSNGGFIVNNNSLSIKKVQKRGFTLFQENDVLFAKITPCMENGKGALALNLFNGIGYGSTEFHVFRPRDEKSINFIFYLSVSSKFRLLAESQMTGSAGQQRVSTKYLINYEIASPPLDEQFQIGLRLNIIDNKLKSEETLLAKYQSIKKGLMSDLLSGKKEL